VPRDPLGKSKIFSLYSVIFFLGLLFDLEDGSSIFLRDMGKVLPVYTALCPKWQYSSIKIFNLYHLPLDAERALRLL
jgi:hypothetical protein